MSGQRFGSGQTIVVLDEQDSVPFKMGDTSFLNPPLRLLATPQLLTAIKNMAMAEAEATDGPELTAWLALYVAAADLVKLTGDA